MNSQLLWLGNNSKIKAALGLVTHTPQLRAWKVPNNINEWGEPRLVIGSGASTSPTCGHTDCSVVSGFYVSSVGETLVLALIRQAPSSLSCCTAAKIHAH